MPAPEVNEEFKDKGRVIYRAPDSEPLRQPQPSASPPEPIPRIKSDFVPKVREWHR